MNQIHFTDISVQGNLLMRARLNFDRLKGEEYQPDNLYKEKEYSWPGDFEGRTILALVLLAQATRRQPEYLDKIMTLLPSQLNESGYFGRILPEGLADEQQLSGHSWFLRSMVEYYLWKKDDRILSMIKKIVKNLLLPIKGCYERYPVNIVDRVYEGKPIGSLHEDAVENWFLSTDVGCAFIMLDGATQAYQILKDTQLKELIVEMIEKFLSIDIEGLSFQTHAMLSACRGILRYHETTGDPELLKEVETRFTLYLQYAITENYENYNWFNRPEWTEPCAVIDSFMLATGLWQNTGKAKYLEIAHNIYYNAMGYSQRPNGGFGCNACAGAQNEFLSPKKDFFESYWCCTMRGGEGLAKAIQYNYFIDENTIIVPFYNNSTACFNFNGEGLVLRQMTGYPVTGTTQFEVVRSEVRKEIRLKFYVPDWSEKKGARLVVNDTEVPIHTGGDGFVETQIILKTGMMLNFNFDIGIRKEATINTNSITDCCSLRHGVLILGIDNKNESIRFEEDAIFKYQGHACYQVHGKPWILSPIGLGIPTSEEETKESCKQILFKNP